VVWGFTRQAQQLASRRDPGEVTLPVPPSCEVAGVLADGRGKLLLHLKGSSASECRQLLVVETASGRLLGRFRWDAPAPKVEP